MTTSVEIENYMKEEEGFLGCFAYDDLPPIPNKFPASMIVNTHKKNQPSTNGAPRKYKTTSTRTTSTKQESV